MELLTKLSIGFVAFMHCLFLVLEMFLWRTHIGRSITGLNADMAATTSGIAANQGLYNGFIATGLVWSIFAGGNTHELRIFFLVCVIIAGIFGGSTVRRTIFLVKAVPGAIALGLVLLY